MLCALLKFKKIEVMKKKVLLLALITTFAFIGIITYASVQKPGLPTSPDSSWYKSMAHCGSSFTMKICCKQNQTAVPCDAYQCICY